MKSFNTDERHLGVVVMLLLFAWLVSGCATVSTGAHYDETMDFSKYKSFSWIDNHPLISGSGDSAATVSPLTQLKIQQALRAEFERKGYTFVENHEQADFVVAYTVGSRQEISVSSYPSPYYGAWGWHVHGSHYYIHEVSAHSYTKGTLAVDIFDGATRKPVWHGWAEKTVSSDDKKDPTASIKAAVSKMLEAFPK